MTNDDPAEKAIVEAFNDGHTLWVGGPVECECGVSAQIGTHLARIAVEAARPIIEAEMRTKSAIIRLDIEGLDVSDEDRAAFSDAAHTAMIESIRAGRAARAAVRTEPGQ